MAKKYDLHHWDNGRLKTFLIVVYCMLKNKVFLIKCDKNNIATYQIQSKNNSLHLSKLAVNPKYSGKGLGTDILKSLENYSKENELKSIICEVYEKNGRAIHFYEKNGFIATERITTLKYTEIRMEKKTV